MVDVELVDATEQPTLGLREAVALAELPAFFDRAFRTVLSALAMQGTRPAGPAYARYRGRPAETVDVEAGFPVVAVVPGDGVVEAGALPGGRTVQADHIGSYDTLAQTYDAIESWMRTHRLTPGEEMWELYVVGPESDTDPAAWRTRVVWPVR